jgi:hypothetical protein
VGLRVTSKWELPNFHFLNSRVYRNESSLLSLQLFQCSIEFSLLVSTCASVFIRCIGLYLYLALMLR